MVYAEKVVPPNVVCLRVPLRSWARCRIARMSTKIVHVARRIREKNEMKKHSEAAAECEYDGEQLMTRIVGIENTLKAMEATLKTICDALSER